MATQAVELILLVPSGPAFRRAAGVRKDEEA